MKIGISSDFAGFRLKEKVRQHLIDKGHEVLPFGVLSEDKYKGYVDAATELATAVQNGEVERGVIFCGTGAGVSVACNKFKGIYCIACESLFTAPKTAEINKANILAMGENVVTPAMAFEMVDSWIARNFGDDCDDARKSRLDGLFDELKALEDRNFK